MLHNINTSHMHFFLSEHSNTNSDSEAWKLDNGKYDFLNSRKDFNNETILTSVPQTDTLILNLCSRTGCKVIKELENTLACLNVQLTDCVQQCCCNGLVDLHLSSSHKHHLLPMLLQWTSVVAVRSQPAVLNH